MVKEFGRTLPLDCEFGLTRLVKRHFRRILIFDAEVQCSLRGIIYKNAYLRRVADGKTPVKLPRNRKTLGQMSACEIVDQCRRYQQNVIDQYGVSERRKTPRQRQG